MKSKTAAEESAIPAPAPDDSADLAWQREYFANHRLEAARIPRRFWNKTLKNFTTKDKITRDLVAGATSFVEGFNFKREYPKGLFMIGPVGCGKTHLA
ncbi:hypothetical protein HY256_12525, partial [Candidatus Sumerlaeota bacterium]|nr:hypothetical protein [Candidatus Sumerlaeota bacterium]